MQSQTISLTRKGIPTNVLSSARFRTVPRLSRKIGLKPHRCHLVLAQHWSNQVRSSFQEWLQFRTALYACFQKDLMLGLPMHRKSGSARPFGSSRPRSGCQADVGCCRRHRWLSHLQRTAASPKIRSSLRTCGKLPESAHPTDRAGRGLTVARMSGFAVGSPPLSLLQRTAASPKF